MSEGKACTRVQKGSCFPYAPRLRVSLRSCAAERIYLAWTREIGQLEDLTNSTFVVFWGAFAGFGIF